MISNDRLDMKLSREKKTSVTWSRVQQTFKSEPTGCVSCMLDFSSFSSSAVSAAAIVLISKEWEDTGKIFSWSSTTRQRELEASDRINLKTTVPYQISKILNCHVSRRFLSLKRPTTSLCTSVLYLAWLSIAMVWSCLRELIDLSKRTTNPPPSTVSIVLARIFGVNASKSYFKKGMLLLLNIQKSFHSKGLLLYDTHSKSVPQDFMGLCVVAVSDWRGEDKQLKLGHLHLHPFFLVSSSVSFVSSTFACGCRNKHN